MPSLKMKTKSTMGLKEKNSLHVSRMSSTITKNSLSPAKMNQHAETITNNQSNEGEQVGERLYDDDLMRNCIDHDDPFNEEKHIQMPPSSMTDSAILDSLETIPSTCSSNMDSIFSPILESIDIHNTEGNENLDIPHLDSEDSEDSSRSSFEHHACNVSDFYISDMIFSGPPIERNSVFDNKMDTMFLPDYKSDETNLLCDLSEEYMLLPFLEDALDTGHDHDVIQSAETNINADHTSLYMAIHQVKPYNQESYINTYPDTDYEGFDPQMYIKNLPDNQDSVYLSPSSVPDEKQYIKKVTLVLDLDETLVHSSLDPSDDADFTFPVFFNMKEHTVYVKKRPHLHTFLERVAQMFEIVIFTASQSIYAKQLLDILDPSGKIISRRAYRESCMLQEGCYVKDLTVLGVDLGKVAIIDNCPQVFRLQVNNGIPIKSWFDDPSDCALISLLPFLESLINADDVRPIIARKFGNKE